MCLILFAHDAHPEYRLVLGANRDEFHARPAAPAGPWPEAPHVIAGRDLLAGGTWLGVTKSGRWAGITNYRAGNETPLPDAPSRGHLVSDYLRGKLSPDEYARRLAPHVDAYNGFNLLVGDASTVVWISNRRPAGEPAWETVAPGVHGISNHLLDTPWPKVTRGKSELASLVDGAGPAPVESILGILLDRTYAVDHELPDTGVPLELERALSSPFVSSPTYGTRSSTALIIGRDGRISFVERRFDAAGSVTGEDRFEIAPD